MLVELDVLKIAVLEGWFMICIQQNAHTHADMVRKLEMVHVFAKRIIAL